MSLHNRSARSDTKLFLAAIAAMQRRHGGIVVIVLFDYPNRRALAAPLPAGRQVLRSLRETPINMHKMKRS